MCDDSPTSRRRRSGKNSCWPNTRPWPHNRAGSVRSPSILNRIAHVGQGDRNDESRHPKEQAVYQGQRDRRPRTRCSSGWCASRRSSERRTETGAAFEHHRRSLDWLAMADQPALSACDGPLRFAQHDNPGGRVETLASGGARCRPAPSLQPPVSTPSRPSPAAVCYDLVIRNGRVLDGAGNPWILADVAIEDGRFAKIGRVPERGTREIDAAGKYVSPGWIDMMDQSGGILPRNGLAENKLLMGVTTAIGGEGGFPVPASGIPRTSRPWSGRASASISAPISARPRRGSAVLGSSARAPTRRSWTACGPFSTPRCGPVPWA